MMDPFDQGVISCCGGVELMVREQDSGVGDDRCVMGVGVGVYAAVDVLWGSDRRHVMAFL
ncbi:hypothetical protein [Rhodococcus sp. SJ-2]